MRGKILVISIAGAVIPALFLSCLFLYQFGSYGEKSSAEAYAALTDLAESVLEAGVTNDRQAVAQLIRKADINREPVSTTSHYPGLAAKHDRAGTVGVAVTL